MTLPKENLDDKKFEELVKEAVSRIPVYAPEWTDHNLHDPGITFIELFAWLAEMQIYRLNMISDKSYRKFLTLVGIHDHTTAASGGEESEKLEEAIIRARIDMKTVYRAVTSADYEHLAMNVPELFSWDNVPGTDSERLLRFLRDDLDIGWAENAEILKSDDDKTIYISESPHNGKSAKIVIEEEEGKATLTTSNGITHDLKVKKENSKLNIYSELVARAKAITRYHPSQGDSEVPGVVTVVVVPDSSSANNKPEPSFLKSVYRHLDEHRLLTTELFVISPEYIEVSVEATVVIKPKYVEKKLEERVREKLENFLHPIRGGVDQKGWPFGRSVYISELYKIIDRVEGVDYVKTVTMKKNGEKQEGDIKISAHDLVCSVTHEIIVIEFLFSIDEQLISELNNKTISKGLREAFKTKKGIAISERAIIVKVGDNKWKIIDGKVAYIITKENKKLNIYKGEIHE
jgi:hypothetical protein